MIMTNQYNDSYIGHWMVDYALRSVGIAGAAAVAGVAAAGALVGAAAAAVVAVAPAGPFSPAYLMTH